MAMSSTATLPVPFKLVGHLRGRGSPLLSVYERQVALVPVTRQGPFPGAGPRPQRLSRSLCAVCGEANSVLSDFFVKFLIWGGRLIAGAEVDTGLEALGVRQIIMQTTGAKEEGGGVMRDK